MTIPYKLAIINSHPIQYFTPLYTRLAQEPDIDLTVYFLSRQGLTEYYDPGFGAQFKWDIPLLEGYKYKFLPNIQHDTQVGGFFSLLNPSIVSELRRGKFDALWVHGHHSVSNILAILSAKLLRIPVFMRCETHLLLSRSRIKRMIRRPIMTFFYRNLCDICLPIGSANRDFYHYHGVGDERLFTVPYTVNNKIFIKMADEYHPNKNALLKELALSPDKPIILFVAKITSHKRPLDLLMAYQHVRDNNVACQLVFVGSGSEEEALKTYVQDHHVPDVSFLGFRNQAEIPKFYAIADLFALPSRSETWGLVVNEAMCSSLPIIASETVGAVADLVKNGENGYTFQVGDVEALASHLSTLIQDSALRTKMGPESRRIISTWDYEACIRGIRTALNAVHRRRS